MGVVGEPIDQNVVKQLEVRESLYSKEIRTDKELRYINSKSSWIRLISGADTYTDGSKQAKELILSGGELRWNSNTNSFENNEGINFQANDIRKTYNYSDSLGIRPVPGITSFSITSKNRFGTIRSAEIEFTVWSKEDLDRVEEIFFRPGFPCIAEWGNSLYVDNQGEIRNISATAKLESYFRENSFQEILNILEDNRKKYDYNYDGFIGFINNFRFSFRTDGGYDCSLSVVSHGTILDSLTFKKSSDYLDESSNQEEKKQEVDTTKYKSNLHFALDQFRQATFKNNKEESIGDGIVTVSDLTNSNFKNDLRNQLGEDFDILGSPKASKFSGFVIQGQEVLGYISIRSFLALCNLTFSTSINNSNIVLTEGKSFSLSYGEKYNTFENHFSLDPGIVFLPKKIVQEDLKDIIQINFKPKGADNKSFDLQQYIIDKKGDRRFDILEIRVSLSYIQKILDSFYESSDNPEQINASDFMKKFLQGLKDPLGGINDFDFAYDEELFQFKLVDRAANPYTGGETYKQKEPPLINLTGLNSLVSDLSIESKLSNQLASAIAISAGSSDTSSTQREEILLEWNSNYKKRFYFKNTSSNTGFISKEKDKKLSKLSTLITSNVIFQGALGAVRPLIPLLRKLINSKEDNTSERENYIDLITKGYLLLTTTRPSSIQTPTFTYDENLFKSILAEGIQRTKDAFFTNTPKSENPSSGIIPISLSFTLEGISGLKIGQGFLIPSDKILPYNYRDYGFLITGLNHSLENNKWKTNITGQTIQVRNLDYSSQIFRDNKETVASKLIIKPGEY